MSIFPKGQRIACCADVGLSQLYICENGQMWDTCKQCYVTPQKNGQIEMRSYDTGKERVRVSFEQLYGYYFRPPWTQYVVPRYRNLAFMNASRYYVLEDGRVFSSYTWNYLIGNLSFDGYSRVLMMFDDSVSRTVPVHRIVAMAFLENPENKNEVNHKDGNKLNNHVSNLEWTWSYENMAHALHNGLRKSSLTDEQIHQICHMLEEGYSNTYIANYMNIGIHHVKDIKSGCHMRISRFYNIPRTKHFNLKPSNNTSGAHRTRISTCADIP